MAKREKGGFGLTSGLETVLGVSGRKGLKGLVNKFMGWLKANQEKLFYDVAFIYTSPKASGAKNGFQGALILIGTVVENISDRLNAPQLVKELGEILFGDLPGTLSDYFEAHKPEFPAGYTEPKLDAESVKQLAQQFNEMLKTWVRDILAGWDKPVQKILSLLGHNQTEQVMTALRGLDNDQWKNFDGFIAQLSPEDRELMAQMLQFFNTPEEVTDWADYRLDRQLEMFEFAKRMHDNRLLGRMIRFGKNNWPKIKDEMAVVLGQVGAGLRDVEQAFAAANVRRRAEIDRTRYAPAALKERPWRNKELPVGDPRRQAPPFRLFGIFRWEWREMMVVAFLALVIILALASGYSGCMTKSPSVAITSTETVKNSQSLKLAGYARADFLVSRIEYQVNDGPRMPIKIWSARQVDWSVKIKPPAAGSKITVYAYDPRAHNPGVTSLEFNTSRSH